MRWSALVLFVVASMTVLPSAVGRAQTPGEDTPFRFDLAEAFGPRGLAVEGFVYNALPWLITNVRLRVDSVDGDGTVIASASGWVIGDVEAGGRGYFWVPVSSPAATYRAAVQSFDKVAPEAPRVEALDLAVGASTFLPFAVEEAIAFLRFEIVEQIDEVALGLASRLRPGRSSILGVAQRLQAPLHRLTVRQKDMILPSAFCSGDRS